MVARQVVAATSVRVVQTLRHAQAQALAHSRVVAECQAHRARRQIRTRQALTTAQALAHHRAVAQALLFRRHARHRHHRAHVLHHRARHRARHRVQARQARQARRVLSAVARQVAVAADSIPQGVCLQKCGILLVVILLNL